MKSVAICGPNSLFSILSFGFSLAGFAVNLLSGWCWQLGSHTKKRPDNLVIGRTYDHHIYDLIELGVENFKSMQSFSYDKKIAPLIGTKPFFAFIGEAFENVEELKHLKEILLDLFRGQVHSILHASPFSSTPFSKTLSSSSKTLLSSSKLNSTMVLSISSLQFPPFNFPLHFNFNQNL